MMSRTKGPGRRPRDRREEGGGGREGGEGGGGGIPDDEDSDGSPPAQRGGGLAESIARRAGLSRDRVRDRACCCG